LLVVEARAHFEAVYRAHAGAVRTYVRRRSNAQTADDVVADVFIIAWRKLDQIPDDALPWLLGVARRILANRRRGWAREEALRGRVMFEQACAPSARSVRSEADEAVLRALATLRERDREVLLLVGWEGLEPAQAARVLRVRPNTFAARLSRARRRFAQALASDRGGVEGTTRSAKAEVLP
jgi:RNA polymerase sigma-70 factor (ECF subfamily)